MLGLSILFLSGPRGLPYLHPKAQRLSVPGLGVREGLLFGDYVGRWVGPIALGRRAVSKLCFVCDGLQALTMSLASLVGVGVEVGALSLSKD